MVLTERAWRTEALAKHMRSVSCNRDDDERSFLSGWDAAIATLPHFTGAQIRDFRKPGVVILRDGEVV